MATLTTNFCKHDTWIALEIFLSMILMSGDFQIDVWSVFMELPALSGLQRLTSSADCKFISRLALSSIVDCLLSKYFLELPSFVCCIELLDIVSCGEVSEMDFSMRFPCVRPKNILKNSKNKVINKLFYSFLWVPSKTLSSFLSLSLFWFSLVSFPHQISKEHFVFSLEHFVISFQISFSSSLSSSLFSQYHSQRLSSFVFSLRFVGSLSSDLLSDLLSDLPSSSPKRNLLPVCFEVVRGDCLLRCGVKCRCNC